tara:strand:+ start:474 stop:734 length:261 start_codon:yes stop_codon:yes gene_type:complete
VRSESRAIGIVTIALIEVTQVELIIDHMVEGMFKTAGLDLIRKSQRDHLDLVVIVVFLALHRECDSFILAISWLLGRITPQFHLLL